MTPRKDRREGKTKPPITPSDEWVTVNGWTILAHPLFLDAMERLVEASRKEQAKGKAAPRPNTKLLGHIVDLAFEKIPADPGGTQFRHGGTLGEATRHWFRAKTGAGRYRLFYRFHSQSKVIVLCWVNDEQSLRQYRAKTDAYRVFAGMLEDGNPADDWTQLLASAGSKAAKERLRSLFGGRAKTL